MKIAILHEMLVKNGWAEKVVSELVGMFPKAPLYTLIYDESMCGKSFPKNRIHPSCFRLRSQKVYSLTKKQRLCLPFMKRSIKNLDFESYDYVIVSSSGFAHQLKKSQNTTTIIYYHAPARYLWDWTHEFRKNIKMNAWIHWYFYRKYISSLRVSDYEAAQNNDIILTNSATTQKRILKYFRKESEIIYPPIETARFAKKLWNYEPKEKFFQTWNYYIILSALTEFKRLDIAIQAFKNIPDINLLITWAWEYREELEKTSLGHNNIIFSGAQYGDSLVYLVQNSLGLIFPWEEDFWIVPIEIMSAGKPVFALWKWGLTESVIARKTGEFFFDTEGVDFIEEFQFFHKNNVSGKYKSKDCIAQAKKYDREIFKEKIQNYIT